MKVHAAVRRSRLRCALIAAALLSSYPVRAEPAEFLFTGNRAEFLFTGNRAISLAVPNNEISLETPFDVEAVKRALPFYDIEFREYFDHGTGIMVSRNGVEFLGIGSGSGGRIDYIEDWSSVVDAAGVRVGTPMTKALNGESAECSTGLRTLCRSAASRWVWYVIGGDEGCHTNIVDYEPDRRLTRVRDCDRVTGLLIAD